MTRTVLPVGSPAPPFTLPDHTERDTSLSDFAGRWVVLYFYPKDDTPGCTTEACEFTAAFPEFAGMNAEVLGCSPDTPASHRRFIERHGLRIRLLSDREHQVMNAYGAWGEKSMYGRTTEGVIRSTVIIAPDGTVAAHWPSVRAAGHAAKVRETLAALQEGRS